MSQPPDFDEAVRLLEQVHAALSRGPEYYDTLSPKMALRYLKHMTSVANLQVKTQALQAALEK
jgi:hypothetical protein